jgi:putative protease
VVRSSGAELLERARASYAGLPAPLKGRKTPGRARVFGQAGAPLKLVLTAADDTVSVRGELPLAAATNRALDATQLREQLGRLGDTPFVLGALDSAGLASGLFLPVSELNRLRQSAVDELLTRRDWTEQARLAERRATIDTVVGEVRHDGSAGSDLTRSHAAAAAADLRFALSASVYRAEDARAAAASGATEVVFDPFVRHPAPPVARVRALADELASLGVALRIRTPSIVRPQERRFVDKWLAAGFPVLSGHLGLVGELGAAGRDVVADYAVNVFNQHAASQVVALGARRLVASVELTVDELAAVSAPWGGAGFDVFVYGRPEGMTIEHCVLSAAFDRVPTTCRDLCVQKHTNVELTDPAGYAFAVATDSACRNRLLHSRPVEGSEFLPRLWAHGIRGYHLVFNVPGEPVADVVGRYRAALASLAVGGRPDLAAVREVVGSEFTRGHFARAV